MATIKILHYSSKKYNDGTSPISLRLTIDRKIKYFTLPDNYRCLPSQWDFKNGQFTNNLAERDIRPVKVKQKISNCFRTLTGAEIYARIQGFVSTSRKHNRNVFAELSTTFAGQNFITADYYSK